MKIETIEDFIALVETFSIKHESPLDWRGHDTMPPSAIKYKDNASLGESFKKVKDVWEKHLKDCRC